MLIKYSFFPPESGLLLNYDSRSRQLSMNNNECQYKYFENLPANDNNFIKINGKRVKFISELRPLTIMISINADVHRIFFVYFYSILQLCHYNFLSNVY